MFMFEEYKTHLQDLLFNLHVDNCLSVAQKTIINDILEKTNTRSNLVSHYFGYNNDSEHNLYLSADPDAKITYTNGDIYVQLKPETYFWHSICFVLYTMLYQFTNGTFAGFESIKNTIEAIFTDEFYQRTEPCY